MLNDKTIPMMRWAAQLKNMQLTNHGRLLMRASVLSDTTCAGPPEGTHPYSGAAQPSMSVYARFQESVTPPFCAV
jgi:hypothetical protein